MPLLTASNISYLRSFLQKQRQPFARNYWISALKDFISWKEAKLNAINLALMSQHKTHCCGQQHFRRVLGGLEAKHSLEVPSNIAAMSSQQFLNVLFGKIANSYGLLGSSGQFNLTVIQQLSPLHSHHPHSAKHQTPRQCECKDALPTHSL